MTKQSPPSRRQAQVFRDLLAAIAVISGITFGFWMLLQFFSASQLEHRGAYITRMLDETPMMVYMLGPQFSDEELGLASKVPTLTKIDASRSRVSHRGIQSLTKLQNLKELVLNETDVDENVGPVLARLDHLITLDLSNTNINDDVLRHISTMSRLSTLRLDGCKSVSFAGLRQLNCMKSLKTLSIKHVPLSYEELLELDQIFSRLKLSSHAGSMLGLDKGGPLLASWTGPNHRFFKLKSTSTIRPKERYLVRECLERLPLKECVVEIQLYAISRPDEDCVRTLLQFPNLESVEIRTIVTQTMIDTVVQFPHLKHLDIRHLKLKNDLSNENLLPLTLKPLTQLTNLNSLSLFNIKVSPEMFAELKQIPGLGHLALQNCGISDPYIEFLMSMQSLRTLNLSQNKLTEQSLAVLRHLPYSTGINLRGNSIDPGVLAEFKLEQGIWENWSRQAYGYGYFGYHY